MPKVNGIGHSDHTYLKQIVIYNLFRQNIGTVYGICKSRNILDAKYVYIDATAGPGRYNDVVGSPIQFWNAATSYKYNLPLNFKAYFIEKNKEILKELQDNLPKTFLDKSVLIHGDYCNVVPDILNSEGRNYGILYIDPNGLIDFDGLQKISRNRKFKLMDIIIHIGAVSLKRVRGAVNNKEELIEGIKKINKSKWHISETFRENTQQQWFFLFGTNNKNEKYKPKSEGIKFYDLNNYMGNRILHRLNFTKKEYVKNLPGQLSLDEIDDMQKKGYCQVKIIKKPCNDR